ncbi:hypothetical protein Hanom_Chr11g01020241 [Helianthus anomalus]
MGTSPTSLPLYRRIAELGWYLILTLLGFLIVRSKASERFKDILGGNGVMFTSKSSSATEFTVRTGFLALKTVKDKMSSINAIMRIAASIDEQMMMHLRRFILFWSPVVGTMADLSGSSSFFSMSIEG